MTPAGMVPTTAIASARGWSRQWAWRYLTRLEREHGLRLVRDGRTIYVDPEELRRAVALESAKKDARVVQQVGRLKKRVCDLEERQKATEMELREFRRLAHQWLTKPQAR